MQTLRGEDESRGPAEHRVGRLDYTLIIDMAVAGHHSV